MSAPIGDKGYAYDTCEACGTDNEPTFTNGQVGTESQNWATYVCGGPGKGSASDGCGRNWSVTTQAGIEHNTAAGQDTIGRFPRDVVASRHVSAPSEAFRANYAAIFGHE